MSKKDMFICRFVLLLKPRSIEHATFPQAALLVLCLTVWEVAGDSSHSLITRAEAQEN